MDSAMDSSDPLLSSKGSPNMSPGVGHKDGGTSPNSCEDDTLEENGNDDVSDTFKIELEEEVPNEIEN